MAKLFGLVVTGFILVFLLSGSNAKEGKLPNNLRKLFQAYYSNFELLRLFGNSFNHHSFKGFSAKFHEYSRKNYDLALYILDLSNKHNTLFDFQTVALSNYIHIILNETSQKTSSVDIKGIKTSVLDFYKHEKPIRPVEALTFYQFANEKYMHKIIYHLLKRKVVHLTYIMKKVYLKHLYYQVKEISDMRTRLASNDALTEFLLDKSLRSSQPKYQEFYKC